MASAPARADPPKVAVFDFELLDTSLQGEVNGPQTDEQERLMRVGDQVRKELADSGKFQVLDIAPVNAAAHGSNLQACGGCDVQFAQRTRRRSRHHGRGAKGFQPHPQHEHLSCATPIPAG